VGQKYQKAPYFRVLSNILAAFRNFCEDFSSKGFFDSLVGRFAFDHEHKRLDRPTQVAGDAAATQGQWRGLLFLWQSGFG
jgi:hypothetical protein